jgi:hypothetical protein
MPQAALGLLSYSVPAACCAALQVLPEQAVKMLQAALGLLSYAVPPACCAVLCCRWHPSRR